MNDTKSIGSDRFHTLKAVYVQCPECAAEHCRPIRVSKEDPPETIEGKCYAPHPARGNIFDGCGEVVDLEVLRVEEHGGNDG